ncbi:hypothetical protein GCK72_013161 [Caenorhabditis remanei]|uniref:DUF281 domain-containing protein n=1 Tax=Caenorhabditis remanei TaxID=31234 RepID=A0A6A5GN19_CAERE|nr:hypothetical protein GCK72_013161 [Caenorhabditis remanei]KAF1756707.1 hypothetical protein GCK72_013161 [Caenorhabditis remanei]
MQFLPFVVLVLSIAFVLVAAAPTTQSESQSYSFHHNNHCNNNSRTVNNVKFEKINCTAEGTLTVSNGEVCTVSTYKRSTVTVIPLPEGATEDPLNGVAQCTKTPCDVKEAITVDCSVAFTEKQISDILTNTRSD